MAGFCAKCGKKIGMFAYEPFEINDELTLCYDCFEPIRKPLLFLLETMNKEGFDENKKLLIEKCNTLYETNIINAIEKKIDCSGSRFISETELHEIERQKRNIIDSYMLSTGYEFNGYNITKYMGVVSGQVVLGTGFLSEFTASFADFFGSESNEFADKLEKAKNAAIEKLIIKSIDKGGNAIIGVDFDYITFHGNMIGVVANGTSVVVEKEK